MKRILAALMVMTICLSMGMGVNAEKSKSPESDFVIGTEDKNDNDPWGLGYLELNKLSDKSVIDAGKGELPKYTGNAANSQLLLGVDVNWVNQGVAAEFPISVDFKVNGVTGNTILVVLQDCGAEGWKKLDYTVGKDTVSVEFHGLGAIMIFAEGAGAGDGAGTGSGTGTGAGTDASTPTSPKTGDMVMMMAGTTAIVSAAGLLTMKSKKEN